MASDDAGDTPVSTTVEEPLQAWLDDEADQLGVSRAELLRRLLAAHRTVAEENGTLEALLDDVASPQGPDSDEIAEQFSTLERSQADLEADFHQKIDDVRERVVQIKRETDRKASTDHDHADLREQAERTAGNLAQLRAEIQSLQAATAEVREEVDTGFENYEDVLEYLTDATDDLEEKLTVLAGAVLEVRDRTATVATRESARQAAGKLARQANKLGVRTARCEECGRRVDIGLLARPECPHCAVTFSDVEDGGWFRPATLVVGDVPALEGASVELDAELEAIADDVEDEL